MLLLQIIVRHLITEALTIDLHTLAVEIIKTTIVKALITINQAITTIDLYKTTDHNQITLNIVNPPIISQVETTNKETLKFNKFQIEKKKNIKNS